MDFQGNLILDSLDNRDQNVGQFTAKFPSELIYSHDDFLVGLKEAHLPFDWLELKETNHFVIYQNGVASDQVVLVPPMEKKNVIPFINNKLADLKSTITEISFEVKSGHTYITSTLWTDTILFTPELAQFLGFKNTAETGEEGWAAWPDEKRDAYMKRYSKTEPLFNSKNPKVAGSKRYQFSERAQEIIAKHLFIHADCVKHHLLGSSWSQILQILPNKKVDTHRFERPSFYPLFSNRFDSITIKLTDERGKKIKLKDRILLVLEIRRIK